MNVPLGYNIALLTRYELALNWISFFSLTITSALAIGKLLTKTSYDWVYIVVGLCFSTLPAFLKATIAEHKLNATAKRDGERSIYQTEFKKEKIIKYLQSVQHPPLIRVISVQGDEPINLANEVVEICQLAGWNVAFGTWQHFPHAPTLKGIKIHPYDFHDQAEVLLKLFSACNIKASIQQADTEHRNEVFVLVAYHP